MACHRGLRRLSHLLLVFAKKNGVPPMDTSFFLDSTFLSIEAMFFDCRFVFVEHLGG